MSGLTSARNYYGWLVAGYLAALLWATLAPMSAYPVGPEVLFSLPGLDKLIHVALFGGFAILLLWRAGWPARLEAAWRPMAWTVALAGLVELLQSPLPYRNGDLGDLLAGTMGAILAALAVTILARRAQEKAATE